MEDIEEAVLGLQQQSARNGQFLCTEKCDDLIVQGNDAINALIERFHELDRQKFRQLVKTAQKEQEQGKPLGICRAEAFSLFTRNLTGRFRAKRF